MGYREENPWFKTAINWVLWRLQPFSRKRKWLLRTIVDLETGAVLAFRFGWIGLRQD